MASWWRIGKDLATMDHKLEKGKGQAWGLASRNHCDGEEQVNAWIRWINDTMKTHVRLRVNDSLIKKEIDDMDR